MIVGYQAGSSYALVIGSLVTNREILMNINPVIIVINISIGH